MKLLVINLNTTKAVTISASLGWRDLDKARHETLAGAIEINSLKENNIIVVRIMIWTFAVSSFEATSQ